MKADSKDPRGEYLKRLDLVSGGGQVVVKREEAIKLCEANEVFATARKRGLLVWEGFLFLCVFLWHFVNFVKMLLKGRSKAVEEFIAEDHECAICLELMYRPVELPCKHRFCGPCASAAGDRYDACPLCGTDAMLHMAVPSTLFEKKLRTIYPRAYRARGTEHTKAVCTRIFKDVRRAITDVDSDCSVTPSQRRR